MKLFLAWFLFAGVVGAQESAEAHLQQGIAFTTRWIPGADSVENQDFHDAAVKEFEAVLNSDPRNSTALAYLASLAYDTSFSGTPEQKAASYADAMQWNRRRIAANPDDPDAYYQIGVIAWSQAFGPLQNARITAGMKPERLGPISDLNARMELQARFSKSVGEGLSNLRKAIELDPKNADAMTYLNLLLRTKADLEDSVELAQADIVEAQHWAARAVTAKNRQVEASQRQAGDAAVIPRPVGPPSPPPPPPPPPMRDSSSVSPIESSGEVAEQNLIRKVAPVYPEVARQYGIQGRVQFTATISAGGDVVNLYLVRGHPLLAGAARDAAVQWKFRPVMLNGKAVPVIVNLVVEFPQ